MPSKIQPPLIMHFHFDLGMLNCLMVGYKESATRSTNILDLQQKLPMKAKQLLLLLPNMLQDSYPTITIVDILSNPFDVDNLLNCLFVISGVQALRAVVHTHMEEIPKLPLKTECTKNELSLKRTFYIIFYLCTKDSLFVCNKCSTPIIMPLFLFF